VRHRSALGVLFLVVFVDLLGFGMVIPVMPLYAERLGASAAWTGLLSTGYSAMQFLFAPIWGRLSDRVGRRPVLLLSIAMTGVAFVLYGLADSFPMLLLSRLFAGAATANIAIAQAYVADVTPPEGRAKGMGMIGAAFGLGFVLGPAIGGFLSKWGLEVAPFAAAGLSALNLAAGWVLLAEPEQRRAPAREGRLQALVEELRKPGIRRMLFIFLLVTMAFSAMEATYAFLAAERFGLDERQVSWLFAYIGVIVVIVQGGVIGPLTRRLGEKRVLIAGLALQALGLGALPEVHGLAGLLLASAPLSVGAGLANPALMALLSRTSRDDDQGGTMGLGQSASAIGRIIGPEAGTWTYSRLSPAVPYLGGAAVMALAALVGATLRDGRGPAVGVESPPAPSHQE